MEFEFNTISELFFNGTKIFANNKLYFDKVNGDWVGRTYGEVRETVENFAFGLASLGIDKNDKVAILSANNSKWAMYRLCHYFSGCRHCFRLSDPHPTPNKIYPPGFRNQVHHHSR